MKYDDGSVEKIEPPFTTPKEPCTPPFGEWIGENFKLGKACSIQVKSCKSCS